MQRTLLFAVPLSAFLLIVFCHTLSPGAQTAHRHQHEHPEKLGRVNFPVSCTSKAQKQFTRAVAWLHSFEYEEAEKAFTEVTLTDPRCGMGYWGIAMSSYHIIWAPPNAADLAKLYYGKLVALCRVADSARPELKEAKEYLAGANAKLSASTQ